MNAYPISITAHASRGRARFTIILSEADAATRDRIEPAVNKLVDALCEINGNPVSLEYVIRPDIDFERSAREFAESDARIWREVAEELSAQLEAADR